MWEPSLGLTAFEWTERVFTLYVGAINSLYLLLMLLGHFTLRRSEQRLGAVDHETLDRSPLLPGICVLAPAFNEERVVRESVRSMLALRHPSHEVIVVNDGSTDGTLAALIEEFHLYRSSRTPTGTLSTAPIRGVYESADPIPLVVIDKANGGSKADALNAGVNFARLPLIAAVDCDSLLEPDALVAVARPFLEDHDGTVAAGGIVRVVNGCTVEGGRVTRVAAARRLLPRLQAVEYLRAFLGGRVAFSLLDSLLIVSGAFGVFRRDSVVRCGGFSTATVGEDMELVLRLHQDRDAGGRRRRVVFVSEPVCWTQVPETLRSLRSQRRRWQRGAIESLMQHRRLCSPRFGLLGCFGIPFFVLFETLGPIIELAGLALTVAGLLAGLVRPSIALEFFVACQLFGIVLSVGAVLLEESTERRYPTVRDVRLLIAAAGIEGFGYRQLTAWWRIEGLIDYFRGRPGWTPIERIGFS